MGFTSEGRGLGSTFFFELPLYSHSASELFEKTSFAIDSNPSTVITQNPTTHRPRYPRRKSLITQVQPISELLTHEGNSISTNIVTDDFRNEDIQFNIEEHTEVHFDSDGFGLLSAKGKAIRKSLTLGDVPPNFSLHSFNGDPSAFSSHHHNDSSQLESSHLDENAVGMCS